MRDFAEETTIHGVAEFYQLRGYERLLWFLAFCGSLTFLGLVSLKLMNEFVNQASVTKTDTVEVRFPPFAFVRSASAVITLSEVDDDFSRAIDNDTDFNLVEHFRYKLERSNARLQKSCFVNDEEHPLILKLLKLIDESYYDYDYVNEKAKLTGITITKVERTIAEGDRIIDAQGGLAAFVTKVAKNPHDMYWITNDVGGDSYKWESFEDFPITVQPSYGGVKHIVDTREGTSTTDGLRVELLSCVDYFSLQIGTSVFKADSEIVGRQNMSCGQEHIVTVQLTRYTREDHYCSKAQTESEFSCLTDCWIEETKKNRSRCMPYLGASAKTVGVPICDVYWRADNSNCEPSYQKCKNYCDSCPTCDVMCDETIATITSIVSTDIDPSQRGINSSAVVRIYAANRHAMVHVHISQKISIVEMISSLGGTLGLCIGASLLSFLHVFVYWVKTIRGKIDSWKQRE